MRSNRLGHILVVLVVSSIVAFLVGRSAMRPATESVLAQGVTEQSEELVNRLLVINTSGSVSSPSRAILIDTTDGTVLGVYDYPYETRAAIPCTRDKVVIMPNTATGMTTTVNVIDLVSGHVVATTTLELVGAAMYYLWSCPPSDSH